MFRDMVVLQVEGISIIGQIFLPDKRAVYPLVCLCHGAPSGNPPEPGDGGYPALAEKICREDFAVFFFNFRGTGDSGGNIDFLDWTRDLKAVIDHLYGLEANVDKSHLSLVGFSAGAAVSICVASKDKRITAVAACACPANFDFFTMSEQPQSIINRFRDMGAIRDDNFPPSVQGWFANLRKVAAIDYIEGIAPRPLLLVHGSRDETVSLENAHELYERAGRPKKLVVIDGAGHKLRREERAVTAILDWLKSSH